MVGDDEPLELLGEEDELVDAPPVAPTALAGIGLIAEVPVGVTLALVGAFRVEHDFGAHNSMLQLAIIRFLLGVFLVAGGIAVILRKPWGWWLAMMFQLGLAVLDLRFLLLGRATTEFREAARLGSGIPFLVGLALVVLLCLPSTRVACGVKDRPFSRRPRRAGRPARAPRRR